MLFSQALQQRVPTAARVLSCTRTSVLVATGGLLNPPGAAEVSPRREPALARPVGFSVARRASGSRASALLLDQPGRLAEARLASAFAARALARREPLASTARPIVTQAVDCRVLPIGLAEGLVIARPGLTRPTLQRISLRQLVVMSDNHFQVFPQAGTPGCSGER